MTTTIIIILVAVICGLFAIIFHLYGRLAEAEADRYDIIQAALSAQQARQSADKAVATAEELLLYHEGREFDGDGEPIDPKDLAKTLFRAVTETHNNLTETTSTLKSIIEK